MNLGFRTAPSYDSIQLNIFFSVSVLNNGRNFHGWSISKANLSCLKENKFMPNEFGAKASWQLRVASLGSVFMKFSI